METKDITAYTARIGKSATSLCSHLAFALISMLTEFTTKILKVVLDENKSVQERSALVTKFLSVRILR